MQGSVINAASATLITVDFLPLQDETEEEEEEEEEEESISGPVNRPLEHFDSCGGCVVRDTTRSASDSVTVTTMQQL